MLKETSQIIFPWNMINVSAFKNSKTYPLENLLPFLDPQSLSTELTSVNGFFCIREAFVVKIPYFWDKK